MIREILKMLNQYAVDNPTLPVNLRFSHLFKILAEIRSRSVGMPSRNDGPRSVWDTAWYIGKRFCIFNSVFFSTLSARDQFLEY